MVENSDPSSGSLQIDFPTITVTASGTADRIDREYYYPSTVSSGEIVTTSTTDLGIDLDQKQKEQLVESLDVVKTFVSEMELSFGPLKIKIKRSPMKKIIKTYKEPGGRPKNSDNVLSSESIHKERIRP